MKPKPKRKLEHDRGTETRAKILAAYQARDAAGEPPPTVQSLANELYFSIANISFHMKKMREAGILNRVGRRHCLALEYRRRDESVASQCS